MTLKKIKAHINRNVKTKWRIRGKKFVNYKIDSEASIICNVNNFVNMFMRGEKTGQLFTHSSCD